MDSTSKSSGILDVDTHVVNVGKTIVTGVQFKCAAANCTVILYDNATAASGTVLLSYTVDFDLSDLSAYVQLPDVRADNGLVAVVSGAAAEAIVHYK